MLIWFSRKIDLNDLLDLWRDAGTNYNPDQPIDRTWRVDGHEKTLGTASMPGLFDKAVKKLFRYDIYPPSVMSNSADFIREDRFPTPGDRIVQRIRVIPGFLDAVTMNIVSAVWHEPGRRGFTIITSEIHYEMGEWTATISRKKNGEIALMVHAISRPSSHLPIFARGFSRKLQIRAHRLALEYFYESLDRE